MQLEDLVRYKISKFAKSGQLPANPHNIKYSFVGNYDAIRLKELDEDDAWLSGNANKLLNIYTVDSTFGFVSEPIYNRNKQNLYWSVSSQEGNIKRTHSSFLHDMIYTMSSKVGAPHISSRESETNRRLDKMVSQCDFGNLVTQTIIPTTSGQGTVVMKPCFDLSVSPIVIPQIYNSHDIRIVSNGNVTIGVLFLNYYADEEGKDYVLAETRYRVYDKERNVYSSVIDYSLFKMESEYNMVEVPLNSLPETELLSDKPTIIFGETQPLCKVIKFYQSNDYPDYGESIVTPKIDLADDLDQALSQQSTTTRRSTPQEYVNGEYLEKDANGNPIPLASYDRSFNMLDAPISNGDGQSMNERAVFTTQPQLNIDQYNQEIENLKAEICGHFISPSTMGIGMSKKDNGDAQREKEKITNSTRKHIIEVLTEVFTEYFDMALKLDDYVYGRGYDANKHYDISVSFDELNAPTLEGRVNTFIPMFTSGAISEELFVDRVCGNSLSQEQKQAEIDFLRKSRESKKTNDKPKTTPKELETRPKNDTEEGIKSDSESYKGRAIHSTKPKTDE